MKSINQDIYELAEMLKEGCIYVDKTAYFHKLITKKGARMFFLSRPRRFGKSLMINTLKHIFKGERELFEGLAISKTDYKWPVLPVLHFDFSKTNTRDFDTFLESLATKVKLSLNAAGMEYDSKKSAGDNFDMALQQKPDWAVLIDEYDAPICHALDNPELAEAIRKEMSNFYIQLKGNVDHIKFLMMTGISRVAKLSIFSALTTLVDISFDDEYAAMLGFTEDELTEYFDEHIHAHAETMGLSYEEYRQQFKFWYDGYRFGENSTVHVYNPVSATLTLEKKAKHFKGYWAATGKSSLLANYISQNEIAKIGAQGVYGAVTSDFDISDFQCLSSVGLLYQAGYLTIKEQNPNGTLNLGIPNEEVRRDLDSLYLYSFAKASQNQIRNVGDTLGSHDFESLQEMLKAIYAGFYYGPNEKVLEYTFQRSLHAMLRERNFLCTVEDQSAQGRGDLVATDLKAYYIFELKVDEPAQKALSAIKEKNYAAKYMADQRPIYAFGLAFDRKTRQLVEMAWEQLR